jgi:hypothetical protein
MRRISKIERTLVALFVMLAGALAVQLHGASAAQGGAAPELETAIAKRTLARLDRAKIQTIRNATDRADLLAGYDALKAIADNTSQARETVLLAKFHRAALKIKNNGQTAGGSVDECDDKFGGGCKLGQKLCQLNFDMCIEMIRFEAYFPEGGPDGE